MLAAFSLSGEAVVLAGGLDPAYRVGDVVLKRADSAEEVAWKSELLGRIVESGFRVARPVRALDGSWTAEGWMASRYVEGRLEPKDWAQLFGAAGAFHAALSAEPRPSFLDHLDHRWARAHRAAWEQAEVESLEAVRPRLERLRALAGPVHGTPQLIHGDLAGNVLFAKAMVPAILDFSPWWAPVSYAEGILAADALLWYGAGIEILGLVAEPSDFPGVLARGALFRLLAVNEGAKEGHSEYLEELPRYDDLITLIEARS
ncbi:MAG TPA: hypothetical protein VFH50_05595 [Acidimicrobiales bacterium]|nr:hypothetical protein [Acidimicrobiales bacterium]